MLRFSFKWNYKNCITHVHALYLCLLNMESKFTLGLETKVFSFQHSIFFFCFYYIILAIISFKNCFVMFLFYHISNHFCQSYIYEKNLFFMKQKCNIICDYLETLLYFLPAYVHVYAKCTLQLIHNPTVLNFILRIQVGYIGL